MKTIEQLSAVEINEAFSVVMDSAKQKELMDNPSSQKAWMLCFVYDQTLLNDLEKHVQDSAKLPSI